MWGKLNENKEIQKSQQKTMQSTNLKIEANEIERWEQKKIKKEVGYERARAEAQTKWKKEDVEEVEEKQTM